MFGGSLNTNELPLFPAAITEPDQAPLNRTIQHKLKVTSLTEFSERTANDIVSLMKKETIPTIKELSIAQAEYLSDDRPNRIQQTNDGPIVLYQNKMWVPPKLRLRVMDAIHYSLQYFHPGTKKMLTLIRRAFNWEGLSTDVHDYARACLTCLRTRKIHTMPQVLSGSHPITSPFQTMYMDHWGPITWNHERKWLLTMIDPHTKMVEIHICKDKSARTTKEGLMTRWIARYGAPRVIISDNDLGFKSTEFRTFLQTFQIKQLNSATYHPQGNAPIEAFHKN
jgi:hypothetical protein